MARLPEIGGDEGSWGEILNEFLLQSHELDGTIKAGVVTKSDVGLGNVNNTSDANKPISSATQAALDEKANTDDLGTAASADASDFATAVQGSLADTAVQPGDLGSAATADSSDFATAAQGALADTAVQPADLESEIDDAVADAISSHASDTTSVHGIADTSLLVATTAGASPNDDEVLTWSTDENAYVPLPRPRIVLLKTNETEPPADTPIGTIVYRKV